MMISKLHNSIAEIILIIFYHAHSSPLQHDLVIATIAMPRFLLATQKKKGNQSAESRGECAMLALCELGSLLRWIKLNDDVVVSMRRSNVKAVSRWCNKYQIS